MMMIDLGCGNSYARIKSKFSDYDYTGIDNNPEVIVKARTEGIKVIGAKLPSILLNKNSVDLVWSSHLIEHMSRDQQHEMAREIRRICKTGARIVIKCPSIYNLCFFDEPTHHVAFTHSSLSVLFEREGFKTIKTGYTSIMWFPLWVQKYLRYLAILPIPYYCWEVYYEGIKELIR